MYAATVTIMLVRNRFGGFMCCFGSFSFGGPPTLLNKGPASGGLNMLASKEECLTPSSMDVAVVEHHCPRKNGASDALEADEPSEGEWRRFDGR